MAPFCLALMNPISIKVAPDLPQCGILVPYCIHGCSQTHRPNLTLWCLSHRISLSGHPPSSLIVCLYWTLKSTLMSHLHQGPSLTPAGEWGMLRAPDRRTLDEGPQSIWRALCQSLLDGQSDLWLNLRSGSLDARSRLLVAVVCLFPSREDKDLPFVSITFGP